MSDHDELKAAAERYRRYDSGEPLHDVYGGDESDHDTALCKLNHDEGILADAYLAREELLRELVTALELSVETMNGLADQQAMESNWWLTNASIIRTVIAKAKEQLGWSE